MKNGFKYVAPVPFVLALVDEKIEKEIRRKFLHLNFETPPGAPNELGVEDVVGSSGPNSFNASGLCQFVCSETFHIRVSESNQSGH